MPEVRVGFSGWAIVELMGHRRLGGYVLEQDIAGTAFLRIDIPAPRATDELPTIAYEAEATQFYAPGAVYCITPTTPTTEDMARVVAASNRPAPVTEWELRRALPAAPERTTEDEIEEHIDELGIEDDNGDRDPIPF